MRQYRIAVIAAGLGCAVALGGCGSSSRDQTGRTGKADEIVLSKREACYKLAWEMCRSRRGCRYGHWTGPYACRDWFMSLCCRTAGTCDYQVQINMPRMSQCIRQIDRNYDCNRLFTPACFELIPEGTPPPRKAPAESVPRPGPGAPGPTDPPPGPPGR